MSQTLMKIQTAEESTGWGQRAEKKYIRYEKRYMRDIHTEKESVRYTWRKACKD